MMGALQGIKICISFSSLQHGVISVTILIITGASVIETKGKASITFIQEELRYNLVFIFKL